MLANIALPKIQASLDIDFANLSWVVTGYALAFGGLLLLWLIDWSATFAGPTAAKILHSVSIIEHLQGFQRGVVDTKDVVFYLSFTFFTLFVTSRVVESRRWRR